MDGCESKVEQIVEQAMRGGNEGLMQEDADDDDAVYDQGYDWVHGIADESEEVFDDSDYYYDTEEEYEQI